ncbi:hypothetical protein BDV96DRAFT_509883 [Lophiotrema nucula]|uniref:Methyltransferase n=1 Tax=Lophiotrema nucula TaxID=690887 RepID=A0A6A5YFS9_9PLEO|nr:hypothetical protein BDV96DRAFT_509883 [Lophiotrema nucula]
MHTDEITTFKYTKWLPIFKIEKPFIIISNLKPKRLQYRQTNLEFEEGKPQIVQDIRGRERQFALDSHGFQVSHHNWTMDQWYSTDAVQNKYLPVVEDLIRQDIPNVTQVRIFDWRIRRNQPYQETGVKKLDLNDNAQYLQPITSVHIDQSPKGAELRVKRHMGNEADILMAGRVRLINVWRPIHHSVGDCPLAFCDGSSVDADDLIAIDHVTRDHVGETFNLVFREKYRWYYLSDQRPDEVVLFKMFDSKPNIKARNCPHASFQHREIPAQTLPRESIEVRALVFSED